MFLMPEYAKKVRAYLEKRLGRPVSDEEFEQFDKNVEKKVMDHLDHALLYGISGDIDDLSEELKK